MNIIDTTTVVAPIFVVTLVGVVGVVGLVALGIDLGRTLS